MTRPNWAVPFLLATTAFAQTNPAERIRFLVYESARPDKHGTGNGIFTCGRYLAEARDNRAIAMSPANPAVIPAMEKPLDVLEARGNTPYIPTSADWLLLAYARANGPKAYPRLSRMYSMPAYDNALDDAQALAFGFTSYVSTNHRWPVLPGTFFRDRGHEPRDALDRLIRAWEARDRAAKHWRRLPVPDRWPVAGARRNPRGRPAALDARRHPAQHRDRNALQNTRRSRLRLNANSVSPDSSQRHFTRKVRDRQLGDR